MIKTQSNQKNIPILRFPEFSEKWNLVKGRDLFSNRRIHGRAGLPIYSVTIDKGLVPRRSLASKRIENDAKVEDNIVAFPSDIVYNMMRMWQGALGIAEMKCMVSPAYIVLNPKEHVNSTFYKLLLKSSKYIYKLEAYSYGLTSDRLRLYYKDFGMINFPLPERDEQQKIADFLTAVDEKITALQKKVDLFNQYKKGIMQQIFTQQIRFKDEDGNQYSDWEEKNLYNIFSRIKEKNKENNKNVLTISGQLGLVDQESYFNKSVAAKDLSGYYILSKDDFAYNKSYSKGYPMGAIKKLNRYDKGIVSTLYICFRTKEDNSAKFFEQYFNSGLQNREIEKIAQEGARNHGLLNISVKDFFEQIFIYVPSHKEQQKIADFLSTIDDIISFEGKKLERTKRFKKSLIQHMFV